MKIPPPVNLSKKLIAAAVGAGAVAGAAGSLMRNPGRKYREGEDLTGKAVYYRPNDIRRPLVRHYGVGDAHGNIIDRDASSNKANRKPLDDFREGSKGQARLGGGRNRSTLYVDTEATKRRSKHAAQRATDKVGQDVGKFNILTNNCEDLASCVTKEKKQSKQIRTAGKAAIAGGVLAGGAAYAAGKLRKKSLSAALEAALIDFSHVGIPAPKARAAGMRPGSPVRVNAGINGGKGPGIFGAMVERNNRYPVPPSHVPSPKPKGRWTTPKGATPAQQRAIAADLAGDARLQKEYNAKRGPVAQVKKGYNKMRQYIHPADAAIIGTGGLVAGAAGIQAAREARAKKKSTTKELSIIEDKTGRTPKHIRERNKKARADLRKERRRDRENQLSAGFASATAMHTYGGRPRHTNLAEKEEKKKLTVGQKAAIAGGAVTAAGVGAAGTGLYLRGRKTGATGIAAIPAGAHAVKEDVARGIRTGKRLAVLAKVVDKVSSAGRKVAAVAGKIRSHTTGEHSYANRAAKRVAGALGFKQKLSARRRRRIELDSTAPGWETKNGTTNSVRVVRQGYTREREEKAAYKKIGFRRRVAQGVGIAGALGGLYYVGTHLPKAKGKGGIGSPQFKEAMAKRPVPKPKAPEPFEMPANKKRKNATRAAGLRGAVSKRPRNPPNIETSRILNRVLDLEQGRNDNGKFGQDESLYGTIRRSQRQAGTIRKGTRQGIEIGGDLHDMYHGKEQDRRKKRFYQKARFQDQVIKGGIAAVLAGGALYAGHRNARQAASAAT